MHDELPPTEIGNSIFGGEPEIDMVEEARLHGDDAAAVWGDVAAPVQGVPPMQVGPMQFSTHNQQIASGDGAAAGMVPPMQVGPIQYTDHNQQIDIRRSRRPMGQEPTTAAPMAAGFGFLFAAAGAGAGFYFGKWVGAIGGLLSAGGLRNLYYAKNDAVSPDAAAKAQAMQRGLVGLIGLGAGGYLLYRSRKKG